MKIHSSLSKKAYLHAMKDYMSGHFDFGSERFTGFFLGPCFYVTYHSGFEWNRKITNQKNAAVGFVKAADDGCNVHFLRFKGALCPLVFLPLLITMLLISPVIGDYNAGADLALKAQIAFWGTIICAPIITFFEALTQRSEEGRRALLSLLTDPSDPYANMKYIP